MEELLAKRGIIVSYETIRQCCRKFGPEYARKRNRRQGSGRYPKHHDGRNTILVSWCQGGTWSHPEVAEFSGEFPDHEPYVTLDGEKLFWGSNRPGPDGRTRYGIWSMRRGERGWEEPRLTSIDAMYVTATRRGDLYTSGIDKYLFEAGTLKDRHPVGVRGSHPYITPDESFMLFDRERRVAGGILSFMFLTVRGPDGRWTSPPELQGDLNLGICPMITPDGRNNFFSAGGELYWVDAEVLANFVYPGEEEPDERIVPIDAEGSFLYLVVPVVPSKVDMATLVKLLHDYEVVIVRGGGVWGVGMQSLSEVLHHPSSVREICLYRIGAFERGLNPRTLEPEKAKRW